MKFHVLATAAICLAGSAAWAQDADSDRQQQGLAAAAQSEDTDADEEENSGEEIVCRTERVTGSLTRRRRTCMTRNEWTALEARTRDDMIRSGRSASGSQCIPTGPQQIGC